MHALLQLSNERSVMVNYLVISILCCSHKDADIFTNYTNLPDPLQEHCPIAICFQKIVTINISLVLFMVFFLPLGVTSCCASIQLVLYDAVNRNKVSIR
jgi:hypothetical protein